MDRIVEVVREIPVEVIKEVDKVVEVPHKYYVNDRGQVFDQEGNEMDDRLFNQKMDDMEKKILKYKK